MKKLSFIIPCYNSSKTIKDVVANIYEKMEELTKYDFEVILINDCSSDNTFEAITDICNNNSNVTGIDFAKNFGQHSALMAGFRESTGDIVVCLDDDGQTPVNEVHKLLNEVENGTDVVYAKYIKKKHSGFRNLGSKLNDFMLCFLLNKPKDLYASSYFAAKRFIVDSMINYQHSYPYIMGLVLRSTQNIKNVEVTHCERKEGSSGYTAKKLLSLWINGLTAFSVKPLRIADLAGVIISIFGILLAIYAVINKIINPLAPLGWSSLISVFSIVGGLILLILGIIGEYIGRTYISINNNPQYVIRTKTNKKDIEDIENIENNN